MRGSRLVVAALTMCAACSLDLSLPQEPSVGALAGALDTGGRVGVSNLDVGAIDDQGTRITVKTGDDGGFRFADVKPRLYALEVKVPGFAPLVVPNVRVRSGETNDVGVLKPAWLGGTDAESRVVGKVAAASGSGEVLGASVEFLLQPGNDRVASEVVGLDGEFDVRLPPGAYTLRAAHPNYVTAERRDVTLPSGTTVDLRTMPLLLAINPATLTGTVLKEQEGQPAIPAEGALVTLDSGETTTTDVAGQFMVTGLAAGTRTVRVSLTGFKDPLPTRTAVLRPGQPTALDPITIALLRGNLTGTVEMIDRSPADNVLVTVGGSSYGAVVSPTMAEPFRGTWQIKDVPYGTYDVSATKAGYIKASAQVTLAAATASVSDLKLARPLGDFLIEDADLTNTFGYTRTTAVTLKVTFPATVVEYRASERSDFSDAPTFLPFTSMNQPFTLSASEGIKTVYVQGRDAAAMVGATLSANVTLDTTPPPAPQVTLASTGSVGSGASLVKFTRSNAVLPLTVVGTDATSGVAGLKVSASSALDVSGRLAATTQPYQQDVTFNRPVTTDGVQVVYVQLIDNAGNASALGTDSVVVDTVAPTGSVTVARGTRATVDGFTNQQLVDVTVASAAEPNGGSVLLKLANSAGAELDAALFAPVRPTQPWFLASGADGLRTVYAQFRDTAGNTSAPVSGNVTFDTTAPVVSGSIVGGALKNTTSLLVQVSTSATDLSPTQTISVSEDISFTAGGTVGPTTLPGNNQVNFTLSAGDGVRTVYLRLRDGAGNDGVAPVTLTLDTAPPTGTIRVTGALDDGTPSDALTATTAVSVTPAITGAVDYVLGDASLSACPSSGYVAMPASNLIAATLGGMGATREVRGCFRDAAGNVFGGLVGGVWVPRARIDFDATPPAGCTLALTGNDATGASAPAGQAAQTGVRVSFSGCSETSNVEVAVVVGPVTCAHTTKLPWEKLGTTIVTLPSADGPYTVNACVRDAARNLTTIPGAAITLDRTPPDDGAISVGGGVSFLNTLTSTVSATGTGIASWRYRVTQVGLGSQPEVNVASAAPSSANVTFPNQGTFDVQAVFRDALQNATSYGPAVRVSVDTTAPPIPRLLSIDAGNRGARLFWDPVVDVGTGVDRYELLCGTVSPPTAVCATTVASASDGYIKNLANKRSLYFAVRAVDRAGNPSALSAVMFAPIGWRRTTLPVSSVYPIRPWDIATRGNEVYVTFSELDAEWTVVTGNLRIAVSDDQGRSWRVSTLDSSFAWDRRGARITFSDNGTVFVGSVGVNQTVDGLFAAPATAWEDRGPVRVFASTDNGTVWTQVQSGTFATTTNWARTVGFGMWASGSRLGLTYLLGSDTNTNQMSLAYASSSTFFGPSSYYSGPATLGTYDNLAELTSCVGNYSTVHVWRDGTNLRSMTHYFVNAISADTAAGEGVAQTITSSASRMRLACTSLPEATQAYAAYTSATGSSLGLARKLSSTASWSVAPSVRADADITMAPGVYASDRNVYLLYRTVGGALQLGESTNEGATFSSSAWSTLESNPTQGRLAVLSGDEQENLAVAFVDTNGTSITVMTSGVRSVDTLAIPGVDTARLTWSSVSDADRYDVSDNTTGSPPWVNVNYTALNELEVLPAPTSTVPYFTAHAVDSQGQSGNEGDVWQLNPFTETAIIPTVAAPGTVGGSPSAGIVAYNNAALVLPPYGWKASGDSDLTMYRTTNAGVSWTAHTPAVSATGQSRALAGLQGKAVLLYRLSGTPGLRARIYPDFTTGTPAETSLDAVIDADHIDAQVDSVNATMLVAYTDIASDQIGFAWWNNATNDFTVRTGASRITIPDAATATIGAVEVVKVENARVVVSWRQATGAFDRIYISESTNGGVSWTTPLLLHAGSSGSASSNHLVGDGTLITGSNNLAYTLQAHVTEQNTTYGFGDNLYLTVTGPDHKVDSALTSYYAKFVLDRDSIPQQSVDMVSNTDGHYLAYVGGPADGTPANRLKLLHCVADCHLLKSWNRSILKNWANGASGTSPVVAVADVTSSSTPKRIYLVYREDLGGSLRSLRVLRGGVWRKTR